MSVKNIEGTILALFFKIFPYFYGLSTEIITVSNMTDRK